MKAPSGLLIKKKKKVVSAASFCFFKIALTHHRCRAQQKRVFGVPLDECDTIPPTVLSDCVNYLCNVSGRPPQDLFHVTTYSVLKDWKSRGSFASQAISTLFNYLKSSTTPVR